MKRYLFTVLFCIATLLGLISCEEDSPSTMPKQLDFENIGGYGNIAKRVDSLIKSDEIIIKSLDFGIIIYDLTDDTCLYSMNARKTMRPASIEKIFTAITALEKYGADYQFNTSLFYKGTIENRVFNGDILCVGGMDPLFDSIDMAAFAKSIKDLGIDNIKGRLVADRSFKEPSVWGAGWSWDDTQYNPLLTPLLYKGSGAFLPAFVTALKDLGIGGEVAMIEKELPSEAILLCTRSHSLYDVLHEALKISDNLCAEAVFYNLPEKRPATCADATSEIKNLIRKLGMNPDDYYIADGSGLSTYNFTTNELIINMLKYAYSNPDIYQPLLECLPIAGIDGKLEDRMNGTYAEGRVFAKTGTLTGSSALSGYCNLPNGHDLCFSMISSGYVSLDYIRKFQDNICVAICMPED